MDRAGYRIKPPRLVRRVPRERGPDRFRAIAARGAWLVSGRFTWTAAELALFEAFWVDDLQQGNLAFEDLPRPHDGADGKVRFNAQNAFAIVRAGADVQVGFEDIEFWSPPATDAGAATTVWPAINADMDFDGFNNARVSGTERGDLAGFNAQRNISDANGVRLVGLFKFTDAEFGLFQSFFAHPLVHGALAFTGLPRPDTGAAGRARFDPDNPWEAERVASGYRVAAAIEFFED